VPLPHDLIHQFGRPQGLGVSDNRFLTTGETQGGPCLLEEEINLREVTHDLGPHAIPFVQRPVRPEPPTLVSHDVDLEEPVGAIDLSWLTSGGFAIEGVVG